MPDQPTEDVEITVSTTEPIDEKTSVTGLTKDKAQTSGNERFGETDRDSADVIIVTGADVATHLLPMRDDFDRTLTFRAAILGSGLAAFLAVMTQIYTVRKFPFRISLHFHRMANQYVPSSNQPK